MAANPEDIELGDADEMDEEGEADGGEAAANIQLEEKAVPVCCPERLALCAAAGVEHQSEHKSACLCPFFQPYLC